jgi:uncharacterized integral membrane protein
MVTAELQTAIVAYLQKKKYQLSGLSAYPDGSPSQLICILIYWYIFWLQLGCHPVAVHIYTQTIHRTTQITTNVEECGPCPVFAGFSLAFAFQLRKKHGKTSVSVRKTSASLRKTSVRVQYTYYQNMSSCIFIFTVALISWGVVLRATTLTNWN